MLHQGQARTISAMTVFGNILHPLLSTLYIVHYTPYTITYKYTTEPALVVAPSSYSITDITQI